MKHYVSKEELPMTLDAEDVRYILGLSRAKVYQIFRSDGFPLITIGKRLLCRREDFFEWLDSQTVRNGV
jgi:hypothetical protein